MLIIFHTGKKTNESVDHTSSYSGDHNLETERDNIENTLEIASEMGL